MGGDDWEAIKTKFAPAVVQIGKRNMLFNSEQFKGNSVRK